MLQRARSRCAALCIAVAQQPEQRAHQQLPACVLHMHIFVCYEWHILSVMSGRLSECPWRLIAGAVKLTMDSMSNHSTLRCM